jgi:hypothetical protein
VKALPADKKKCHQVDTLVPAALKNAFTATPACAATDCPQVAPSSTNTAVNGAAAVAAGTPKDTAAAAALALPATPGANPAPAASPPPKGGAGVAGVGVVSLLFAGLVALVV